MKGLRSRLRINLGILTSFGIYKLGEVSFEMLKLGELGEVSFGIYKLCVLGEVSFGMLKLGEGRLSVLVRVKAL